MIQTVGSAVADSVVEGSVAVVEGSVADSVAADSVVEGSVAVVEGSVADSVAADSVVEGSVAVVGGLVGGLEVFHTSPRSNSARTHTTNVSR
jgi:hypothetical protein